MKEFGNTRSRRQFTVSWRPSAVTDFPSGGRANENKLCPQRNAMLECGYSQELLIDVAPVMIWSADADKLYRYFNRPWLTYRGRSIEDEIGTGWLDGIHSDDRDRRHAVYDDASVQLRSFQVEYRLERHDGACRWIMKSAVPRSSSDGRFLGYVGSCVDIHERKLIELPAREIEEALRRENMELRELAYATAHDLQEPLRTVVSYTQLVTRRYPTGSCDAAADECLRFVQAGVERMQALVRGLLHYSSVSPSTVPAAVVVDLDSVLDQAVCVCQGAVAQSGAQITREGLPQIRADEKQLVALFQNLFSNAMKYRRPEVQPRIHVSATAERDRGCFRFLTTALASIRSMRIGSSRFFSVCTATLRTPGPVSASRSARRSSSVTAGASGRHRSPVEDHSSTSH